jgi:adenine deaminase
VLPLGTTAVVADPHEIANARRTSLVLDLCAGLPLDVYFMSCVPRSSSLPGGRGPATSRVTPAAACRAGEMMNFPGVIAVVELAKLALDRRSTSTPRAGVVGSNSRPCGGRHGLITRP